MKSRSVREFITPVENLRRIGSGATLHDAFLAFAGYGWQASAKDGLGRAVLLVEDDAGKIVGAIGVFDLLRGLEPRYNEMKNYRKDPVWMQNPQLIREMAKHFQLWEKPLEDVCKKAADIRVGDILDVDANAHVPSDATLDSVIHLFIMGRQDTLLVEESNSVIGVVRLAEVFAAVYEQVEKCGRG